MMTLLRLDKVGVEEAHYFSVKTEHASVIYMLVLRIDILV